MILGIIAVIIVIAIVIWAVSASNRFKVLLIKITEADSGIDVALTKRYDTITKLMDVVKSYAGHETELFEKVVKLRSGMSMSEKNEANHLMDKASQRINVLAENYPELRSNENYIQLQSAIVEVEDHLQAARRVYNMNVSTFNQAIAVFPASIIANSAHHAPREFFEAEEIKRADVKINL